MNQQSFSMEIADAGSGDRAFIGVRHADGLVGVCMSLESDSDVEVFMTAEECEKLVEGLWEAILRAAADHCKTFALVVRPPPLKVSKRCNVLLSNLQPQLLQSQVVTEWPGTRLGRGGTARRNIYLLDSTSQQILESATDHLYGWCQPELPKDLTFCREDGSPWLFSIAHEREAFFYLSEGERTLLQTTAPEIAKLI